LPGAPRPAVREADGGAITEPLVVQSHSHGAEARLSVRAREIGSGSCQRFCSSWRRASRSQPSRLDAGDDPLRVELELDVRRCLRLALWLLAVGVLSLPLLPGLPEELAPALRRAQLLGQLITTRITVELILGLVGRLRLGEDLLATCSNSRLASRLAFPARRVPSIAINPAFTNPA
jgi:hypothetical protein